MNKKQELKINTAIFKLLTSDKKVDFVKKINGKDTSLKKFIHEYTKLNNNFL